MASPTQAPAAHETGTHAHAGDGQPTHLKEWFVSSEQQFDSAKLGMWLFLITEVLLFSAMFVAYTVYRTWHPETFDLLSTTLDWRLGGLNTLVLLGSSLTVALSIHHAQKNERKKVTLYLVVTVLLALVFMVVKYFEYMAKFEHGLFPGEHFHPHGDYAIYDVPYAPQFFSIYFMMTGIHGLHVLIGMGLLGWMATRAWRGHFSAEWYTPVELSGLYWHLVDIIWIFLFPLLYLI